MQIQLESTVQRYEDRIKIGKDEMQQFEGKNKTNYEIVEAIEIKRKIYAISRTLIYNVKNMFTTQKIFK